MTCHKCGSDSPTERLLKSSWHAALFVAEASRFRREHGFWRKALTLGFMAFHLDAAYNDLRDRPTYTQRLLRL